MHVWKEACGAAIAFQTGHLSSQAARRVFDRIEARAGQASAASLVCLGKLSRRRPGWIPWRAMKPCSAAAKRSSLQRSGCCGCRRTYSGRSKDGHPRWGWAIAKGGWGDVMVTGAIIQALAAAGASPDTLGMYSIRPPLHPLPLEFLAEAGLDE